MKVFVFGEATANCSAFHGKRLAINPHDGAYEKQTDRLAGGGADRGRVWRAKRSSHRRAAELRDRPRRLSSRRHVDDPGPGRDAPADHGHERRHHHRFHLEPERPSPAANGIRTLAGVAAADDLGFGSAHSGTPRVTSGATPGSPASACRTGTGTGTTTSHRDHRGSSSSSSSDNHDAGATEGRRAATTSRRHQRRAGRGATTSSATGTRPLKSTASTKSTTSPSNIY